MARSRIDGKSLTLKVDGNEYNVDVTAATLVRDDPTNTTNDVVTFADASAGESNSQVWFLDVTAIQSTDVAAGEEYESLHSLVYTAAATVGGDEFTFVLAPHGNATASAAQPHFTGAVKIEEGAFPPVGGEAGSTFTFSYRFEVVDSDVTRKITA